MFPTLIDLGTHDLPLLGEQHLFLPTYGFLFALGVVAAWIWFMRRARGLGLPEDRLFNLTFYSVLAGILGAKLLLIVVDWRTYLAHPAEILGTLRSAGVLMGGVLAGTLTFIYYCRRHDLPLWPLADAIVAPLVLAQAMGRLGCFSAGCCWGVPLDATNRLAVTFTDAQARAQTGVPLDVALFPSQLLEMFYDLALVVLLSVLWRRRLKPSGTVFWIYVLLYGVGRGTIEFWRGDVHRGVYFGGFASTSQLIAVASALLAAAMLLRAARQRRQADTTPS
jgi:phosphatidylglycerol:prolipoprotein diacylglycerol transferase